jgi:GTP cyclohydrolase I
MSLAQPLDDKRQAELEHAVSMLLKALGVNTNREGLLDTPRRVAESLTYLTEGYGVDPRSIVRGALYAHPGDDPVTVRNIPFFSLCEHHLLPFFGRCHIGYLPNGRVIGLSKLPRLVNLYAHRLQLQERLTREVAEAIEEILDASGVAVVMEARHLCVEMRGVEKAESETVTSCMLGQYRSASLRSEFLDLIRTPTI